MQTQTTWMLMAEFGTAAVPLADCLHHLGYKTVEEANRAAIDNKLPVPTFRARDSQRSPRMVHIDDLAAHIDKQRQKATESWNAINGIATPAPAARNTRSSRSGRRAQA